MSRGMHEGRQYFLPALACAVCATLAVAQARLMDGEAGRLFVAALVVLAYLVFCLMFFIGHRRKQQQVLRWHGNADGVADMHDDILIIFASQTGFAEQLALQTAQALQAAGMHARLRGIAQLDVAQLQEAQRILFVVSTTGEGDAPDSAAGFTRKVMRQGTLAADFLGSLRYGVLALGDRSYAHYCAFGHALESWLRHHGAQALFDMVDVDNGDAGALRHWQHQLGVLSGHTDMADWSSPGYQRWRLTERRHLNPGSVGEPAFHLALQPIEETALLSWQAGDIAEVGPRNAPGKVDALLAALRLDGNQTVRDGGSEKIATLRDKLSRCTLPHDAAELAQSLSLSAQALADRLSPLPHREYSIASLPRDGRLELLVRRTVLPDGGFGLGSGWLTAWLEEGGELDLRVRQNRGFHPPERDCPLILIGNGTGLAGLRAQMKARIAAGRRRNWLLFGERSREHDFFHQDDIKSWQAQGMLERLDLAFSRDQQQRIYVQDKLRDAAPALLQWVSDGAAIYVCGSLDGMAAGVAQVLTQILGVEMLEAMAGQGRYRRDVY